MWPSVNFPCCSRTFCQLSSTFRAYAASSINFPCDRGYAVNFLCIHTNSENFHQLSVRPLDLLWTFLMALQEVLLISTNSNWQNILLWTLFSQLLGVKSSSTGLNYTPNSWNIPLWFFFPQLLSNTSDLTGENYPKLMKCAPMILFLSRTQ